MAITAPNAVIKLYNTKLRTKANMLVDDLPQYIATCPADASFGGSTGFTIQWQRQEQTKTVKLDLPETKQVLVAPNYCSIKDSNESATGYYFVEKIEQVAENTVRLYLTMDILNTMCYNGGALYPTQFNGQTHVSRRHFDRFKDTSSGGLGSMRRNIMPYSQGAFPTLYRQSVTTLTDNRSNLDKDWYLIYANESGDTINTYLACGSAITLRHKIRNRMSKSAEGNYYYVRLSDQTTNKSVTIQQTRTDKKATFTLGQAGVMINGQPSTIYGFRTQSIPMSSFIGYYSGIFVYYGTSEASAAEALITDFDDKGIYTDTESPVTYYSMLIDCDYYRFSGDTLKTNINEWGSIPRFSARADEVTNTAVPAVDMQKYNKIDTTKKIIKCAYCPINIEYRQGTFDVSTLDVELMRSGAYKDLILVNSGDLDGLNCEGITSFNLSEDLIVSLTGQSRNEGRQSWTLESQLFHSDLFSTKICINDNAIEFRAEDLELQSSGTPVVNVDYIVSENYGQTQGFKFIPYSAIASFLHTDDETNKVLLNAGDTFNQTVYTSAYLDYLNQSYDYDRKSVKFQAVASVIGGAEAVAADIMTGDVYGAAKAVGNTAFSIYQNQRAMDHKIQLLQRQGMNALSVSGKDVANFVYGTQKLRKLRYFPKEHVRRFLANDFYLHGLTCDAYLGETGTFAQEAVGSRYWWNFIQCDPVFNLGNYAMIGDNDYLNDIVNMFRDGVTIYHHRDEGWNLEQTKENWEVGIANRL